jgi:hypothetical protein
MDKMSEAMALGAVRFLSKPVYPQDLLEAVGGVLSRVRGRQRRERSLAFAPLLTALSAVLNPSLAARDVASQVVDALLQGVQGVSTAVYAADASGGASLVAVAPEGASIWPAKLPATAFSKAEQWAVKGEGMKAIGKGGLLWPDLTPVVPARSAGIAVPIIAGGKLTGFLAAMAADREGLSLDVSDIELMWIAAGLMGRLPR